MDDVVFLDTVGLIALLNRDDDYHAEASGVFLEIGRAGRSVMTTNLVLAEVGNGLARTPLREDVVWLIRQLHDNPLARVLHIDNSQFNQGLELYQERADKLWGLVDCVSFTIMKRQGLVDAFTADRHFEQAGFHCLLPLHRTP